MRRVALIDLAGVAGLVTGFAIAEAAGSEGQQQDHFTLLGMATGLVAGTYFTRNVDDDDSDLGTIKPAVGAAQDASGRAMTTYGLRLGF